MLATHRAGPVQRRPQRLTRPTRPETSYVEDVQTSTEADNFESREGRYGLVDKTHPLMRQTRAQYPGATLGGQAGHYPTPAVKGMS